MNLQCLIGRHDLGPWKLYPRLIGVRVEWLRWERVCLRVDVERKWRCRHAERRWFRVRVPKGYQGRGIGKAIDVHDYLKRIGQEAPPVESLTSAASPPPEAFESVLRR